MDKLVEGHPKDRGDICYRFQYHKYQHNNRLTKPGNHIYRPIAVFWSNMMHPLLWRWDYVDNLSKSLKKLANNELITAVGIVYSPQYKDRSLYLTKKGEGFEEVDIAKFYDYTQKDWYKIGLKEKRWVGPFQEVSINERVMRYLVPIYAIE